MELLDFLDQPVVGDYVPAAFLNNFEEMDDLAVSDEESRIIAALRQLTEEDCMEHGVILFNGVQYGDFIQGTTSAVFLPQSSLPCGGQISLFHSHSNSAPPSVADLRYFCAKNVDKICAVAYNGDIFLVEFGDGERPDAAEFEAVCQQIDYDVNVEIMFDASAPDWTEDERNYRAMRESFFRICRHFKWTMRGGRL